VGNKSNYEWKRKRGWFNRTAEKLEDLPTNVLFGKGALTNSRKRALYEKGIAGQATILKVPSKAMMSREFGGEGRYTLRVEIPGRDPYEVKSWQDVTGWDYERLTEGTLVEVRVDPDDQESLVICPPDGGESEVRVMDSAGILAEGRRAAATVRGSKPLGKKAPGTEDEFFLIDLELSSETDGSWSVQIGQRVPKGAEELVAPGCALTVAYLEVDDGDSVAVDWPASTGGRFS
jgi:hypothetical protein